VGVHDEWEFNEWLHGETGHPMGYAFQAWSASMYIYAHHAVATGEVPLFDALLHAVPTASVSEAVSSADRTDQPSLEF
jgi:hypothetical protein